MLTIKATTVREAEEGEEVLTTVGEVVRDSYYFRMGFAGISPTRKTFLLKTDPKRSGFSCY